MRAMSADFATSAMTARLLGAEHGCLLGGGLGGRGVDVVDHDMGALAGIGERDVAAYAAAAAGDDGDLVLQAHGDVLS